MKETKPGIVSRGKSPYVEIEAKRSDTYMKLLPMQQASVGLNLIKGWSSPYLN